MSQVRAGSRPTVSRRSRRAGTAGAAARRRPHGRGRAVHRRRRLGVLVLVALVAGGIGFLAARDPVEDAVKEITLPLRHDDIIRQQARDKGVDAALIAAVIYEESRFRDQTSAAGAKGLMQIVPDTARFIARKTGGTQFELRDLGTPQVNIAYGTWYLRYLLDRYGGEEEPALAAYNAGLRHVDGWVARAGGTEDFDPDEHIRFPETRHYVGGVLEHRDQYADRYPRELGLPE